MDTHSNHPSGAFTVTFATGVFTNCSTFTLDHYRTVLKYTGTPTSPTDGIVVDGTPPLSIFVNRAERTYYAKIYACDNASCTDVFGSGSGEPITGATTDSATTLQEVWRLTSVTGPTDSTHFVTDTLGATSPSSFFYPSGWSREGQLALYYSAGEDEIYMQYTTAAGWQDFNDTTWTDNGVVAESYGSGTDYDQVSHPTVLPVVLAGPVNRVRMLATNRGSKKQIVMVDSYDDTGDDFDLTYGSCWDSTSGECDWPSVGSVAMCADGTSTCDYLSHAAHSRWLWDLVAYGPPVMASEYPEILFMGEESGADGCDAEGLLNDDIYAATWSGSSIDVNLSGSCPEDPFVTEDHDPAVTALPGDTFKVYVMDASTYEVNTHYRQDDGTWEDATTYPAHPLFLLEDDTEITHDCLADLDSFAFLDGSTPREGMFVKVAEDDMLFEGHYCTTGTYQEAIYFAELEN